MADVTIVEAEPEPEIVADPPPVEPEVLAEAAVEIAKIEAGKEVEIAEIQAETEQSQQEVSRDAIEATLSQQEDSSWRRNIETRLASTEANQTEMLSILRELKTAPQNLPDASVSPEVMPESQEVPEPPAPKAKQHHRLI